MRFKVYRLRPDRRCRGTFTTLVEAELEAEDAVRVPETTGAEIWAVDGEREWGLATFARHKIPGRRGRRPFTWDNEPRVAVAELRASLKEGSADETA